MPNTYLYIKQHSLTGLKYFGKTIKHDPYSYLGSGKHWLRHIKKHGKEYVKTTKVWAFDNIDECSTFAIEFSEKNNIVESKEWANLCVETGKDGGPRKNNHFVKFNQLPKTEEIKNKISISTTGKSKNIKDKSAKNLTISDSLKNKPMAECPHCGKISKKLGRFLAFHFDNCKFKS